MLGDCECTVGGMAKGSGMIHPNMATTLNFITSDVAISSELIQKALSEIVKVTYNCLSIDGDTSTNDMVSIMQTALQETHLLLQRMMIIRPLRMHCTRCFQILQECLQRMERVLQSF